VNTLERAVILSSGDIIEVEHLPDRLAAPATLPFASLSPEELERQKTFAPLGGLWGAPMVNVLELNLELRKRYGEPGGAGDVG
jgi:hypothetical protein